MSDRALRVLVVDDHEVVRRGVVRLLEAEPGFDVVGEAGDGVTAVKLALQLTPDVVLMDIRMPQLDGIEATRRIAAAGGSHVVVLTTFDLDEYVYDALQAGASGFLLKDCGPDEVVQALHAAASGAALLSPGLTRRLVERFVRRPGGSRDPRLDQLTPREVDVFRALARGRSNSEIAAELFLGESTVKTHVTNVLNKLGLRDRVQAVVMAYELGVVKPGDTAG